MYDIEKFYQAVDVKDAIRALEADPSAVIIFGESDVPTKIRGGEFVGCSLVSIHGIPELKGIRMEEDGAIVIGLAITSSHVTNNDITMKYIPTLGNTVDQVDGPQPRDIRTVSDNVCDGATSVNSASSFCVLSVILVLEGSKETREVPIREWHTGPGRTVRKHEEVPTATKIRKESCEGFGDHYIKYDKRNVMETVTLGYAMTVKLSDDKHHVGGTHPGYGVAAPTSIRCFKTEEKVKGMETGEALYETVGKEALEEMNPRFSWRTSKEFRLQLVEEFGKRTLKQVIINAGGGADA